MRKERIERLRERMREENMDAYYIPTNDFHGSEYIHEHFKAREYFSGFDGSAGTLVITGKEAGLWTDGRYFLQAEEQLKGSGITLYRSGEEKVPTISEYLKTTLRPGQVLGLDGRLVSAAWYEDMEKQLKRKGITMDGSKDLPGEIWEERPPQEFHSIWLLSEQYAGESRPKKLQRLQKELKKEESDAILLTSLDDIAWLFNARGKDIPCNPVFFSYAVVTQERAWLFTGDGCIYKEDAEKLKTEEIVWKNYSEFHEFVENLPFPLEHQRMLVDKHVIDSLTLKKFPDTIELVDVFCPVTKWKAQKNKIECENVKKAHIQDGIAVTKFIYWLKKNIGSSPMTEISAAQKLEEYRKEREHYLEPSFDTICGYAEHGAIVHYSATEETNIPLKPENFLLVDSGGQYLEGTTDITRTILLGKEATKEQKKYYTAVLCGNLRLAAAKFKHGCSGVSLDYLARQPLWELGCDYNHGTGHGVGYLLNVHEPPNAFRYRILKEADQNAVLEEGMITSDEPGFYLSGQYGIRLENLILCVKREKTEYGQFMGFEPLTFVPFEKDAIDFEQMTKEDKRLLNEYHREVYQKIADGLTKEEREWLAGVCEAV